MRRIRSISHVGRLTNKFRGGGPGTRRVTRGVAPQGFKRTWIRMGLLLQIKMRSRQSVCSRLQRLGSMRTTPALLRCRVICSNLTRIETACSQLCCRQLKQFNRSKNCPRKMSHQAKPCAGCWVVCFLKTSDHLNLDEN